MLDWREEAVRAKAEIESARTREIAEWAEQHGSTRLRRCCVEGIECAAIYRSERLALEYPGWRFQSKVRGDGDAPRNPPEVALVMLDEARASSPLASGAALEFWVAEEKWLKDGDHVDGWRGYVAVLHDERLDWLVWGGPR
jgi:IS5 family transposase